MDRLEKEKVKLTQQIASLDAKLQSYVTDMQQLTEVQDA